MQNSWIRCVLALLLALTLSMGCAGFEMRAHLATKTPYRVYSSDIPAETAPPSGCQLVYANFIARHGTRNPTSGGTADFDRLQEYILDNVNHMVEGPIKQWMANWRNPFSRARQGTLVREGMEEHYGLGERFESKYPELLGVGGYDPAKTTFQNTKKERTAASATAFAAGLYNQLGPLPNKASSVYSFNLPYDKDPTLRPFDMCPAYDNAVHQDPHQSPLFHEHFTYLNAHLPSITSRISSLIYGNISRPGGSTPLSSSTVSTMYDVCTLEYAVFNESQQFCTLFTNEDFLMFEYAADLEEYWSRSFGFPLAYQIGAPLLSEMISTFNAKFDVLQQIDHEARRSEMAPDATTLTSFFRFAHAETMEPILTILGLYNDSSPLRADWTPQQIQNRKFKSSWLFPFASNLALLGYDCANAPSMPERFYIKAQHNERDVTLPACEKDGSLFCGFNTFKTYYASLASVQLSQICGTVPHANPTPTPTVSDDVNTPKFQPIYVWGPITLVALTFVSLTVGYCIGVHSPSRRIVSEPLLSSERD